MKINASKKDNWRRLNSVTAGGVVKLQDGSVWLSAGAQSGGYAQINVTNLTTGEQSVLPSQALVIWYEGANLNLEEEE